MTPDVAGTIAGVREWTSAERRAGRSIGFVPTMGALHAGHGRLIERARQDSDAVIVSIFVNPLQFDRRDDLERYPRTLESDVRLCATLGVDKVFAPSAAEMYPQPPSCTVDVTRLTDRLCGAFRPGHFSGVATVVAKLFGIVRPDRAYFGEKDAQQLAVIRRLVADLNMAIEIVPVPTVREADGLALSSRNSRLSADERALAPALYGALQAADRAIRAGERDPAAVEAAARAIIPAHPALTLEYLEIVDPLELQPVETIVQPVLVAGALWVGTTRLIDNMTSSPREGASGKRP